MAENQDTTNNNQEITLEAVTSIEPADLDDSQKSFLEEHQEELTEDQAKKYGFAKEEDIDPSKIEIETRGIKTTEPTKPSTGDEEEDEIDPADKERFTKLIEKRLGPVEAKLQQQRDELEVNVYLQENPRMAKYKPVILKYVSHPAYSQIPVKNIAAMVASGDMAKFGAQKEREAQRKVDETRSPGSTTRKPNQPVDWRTVSKEDYHAKLAEVLGRRGR